jgi:hypothetical protein
MLDHAIERARIFLQSRRNQYRTVFDNPVGQEVLADLARFCRAHASTFHADHAMSDRLDGRREVWLRIQHHLKLTDDQLWKLYGEKKTPG